MTVKGQMDTNGYLFEQENCLLSVCHLFERLKKIRSKHSTNRLNGLHIRLKYISIHLKYCGIHSNSSDIRSNDFSIRLNGFPSVCQLEVSIWRTAASIRMDWHPFCSSVQKEKIALVVSLQLFSVAVETL